METRESILARIAALDAEWATYLAYMAQVKATGRQESFEWGAARVGALQASIARAASDLARFDKEIAPFDARYALQGSGGGGNGGAGGSSSSQKRRLLAALESYRRDPKAQLPLLTHPDQPTYATGAITNPQSVGVNDPRVNYGATPRDLTETGYVKVVGDGSAAIPHAVIEFRFRGKEFAYYSTNGGGPNNHFRVMRDGQYVTASAVAGAGGDAGGYLYGNVSGTWHRFTFAAEIDSVIRIDSWAGVGGLLQIGQTDSIAYPPNKVDSLKIVMSADSYTRGTGPARELWGIAGELERMLGADVARYGVTGSGLLEGAASALWTTRLPLMMAALASKNIVPDLFIAGGFGYNDASTPARMTDGSYAAALDTYISTLLAQRAASAPGMIVHAFGPHAPQQSKISLAVHGQSDAINQARFAAAGIPYHSQRTGKSWDAQGNLVANYGQWHTGDGQWQNLASIGTATGDSWRECADGIHPNLAGSSGEARKMIRAVAAVETR